VADVLAAEETIGSPAVNISIFGAFVLITLYITFRAGRTNRSATDYYAAGRTINPTQNGLAISGDYLSAASFLGIAGAIAVFGYDGFLYSIGFLVAWLVALLLVAERSACGSARCGRRRRSRRWWSRCSTCWRRCRAPAVWSRCCSGSPARRPRRWS
jgi:hypothetical protein